VKVLSDSADIGMGAAIHESANVWHLAEIREGACLEAGVVVGRGAYIGSGVRICENSKIQNFALVYEPAVIGAGVFIGPGAVLTNDQRPRAVNPDVTLKSAADWDPVGVVVLEGASIGARAVCVAPVTIGAWSMVAAGAVVVSDVPDFALVVGVPARRIGWVGRSGSRLEKVEGSEDLWVCPVTSVTFREIKSDKLVELTDSVGEL
jgi:UDP-2-acetamido-3-amino-2,3-dideoxy-glucuronate N-acetyltransferase